MKKANLLKIFMFLQNKFKALKKLTYSRNRER